MTEPNEDPILQSPPSTPPSDEKLRELLKPNPTHDQILSALKRLFFHRLSILDIIKEFDSYDDRNYVIVDRDDQDFFLLKVHNGAESQDLIHHMKDSDFFKCIPGSIIHLQHEIMEHLSGSNFPILRPLYEPCWDRFRSRSSKPRPCLIDNLPVVSPDHSPCDLVLRLFRWSPGRPMSGFCMLPIESLADAGRLLGKMDLHLDTMDASKYDAAKRFHQRDVKHTADLRKFTECIADPLRRQLVESVIDAFQAQILDSGVASTFRTGINHGDFDDANIIFGEDLRVSGVIDFGDSVESWRVLDISVALAHAFLSVYGKAGRSLAAAAAMFRGYHSVYPLTVVERRHLHLFIACRLVCVVTLGAYACHQNMESKYLQAEPAWKALEMLWGNGDMGKREKVANVLDSLFEQACSYRREPLDESKSSGEAHEPVIDCTDLGYPDAYWLSDEGISQLCSRPTKKQKVGPTAKPLITFATGNKKKLEEVIRIMGADLPCTIQNLSIDLPELQGEPDQICREKCALAVEKVGCRGGAVIIEDTSLCFNALNGLPGPYIKWYLDKCGLDGLNRLLAGWDDKSAYALTIVGFCAGPGQDVFTFEGRTAGNIVPARGSLDFGWDPVFEPLEGDGAKTYAEMSGEEKDAISHRSRAFLKLKSFLIERYASPNP